MSDETIGKSTATELAEQRTSMAGERTRWAADRTLWAADRTFIAWLRTSISMIGFGIGIGKAGAFTRHARTLLSELGLVRNISRQLRREFFGFLTKSVRRQDDERRNDRKKHRDRAR